MPREIVKTVYKYNELDESAKERALDWYAQGVFDYEWWDFIYEDANRIGLKLEYFGLDRDKHATGHLMNSVEDVCLAILKEHGETCDTHTLAVSTLEDIQALKDRIETDRNALDEADESYEDDLYALESELDEDLDTIQSNFSDALLEEYASILQKELEYMQSREYLEEGIIANEYEFDEEGRIT